VEVKIEVDHCSE